MNRLVNRRIRLMLAMLTLAFAGLLLRATWLQGVRAESLARLGQTQHRETVTLPASRGTLFDRTGVELGLGERATTVFANPKQILNPRAAAFWRRLAAEVLDDATEERFPVPGKPHLPPDVWMTGTVHGA